MNMNDLSATLTLEEVCAGCAVEEAIIVELVEFGVVEPAQGQAGQGQESAWVFSVSAYLRIRRALRLRQDLGINEPGIALALELLDEIQEMRDELSQFRDQSG